MLGHFRRAHDRRNRINQHSGFAGCDAGKVFAHHARGRIGIDDGRPRDVAESLGCFTDRVVRTCRDAVTAPSAASKKL